MCKSHIELTLKSIRHICDVILDMQHAVEAPTNEEVKITINEMDSQNRIFSKRFYKI